MSLIRFNGLVKSLVCGLVVSLLVVGVNALATTSVTVGTSLTVGNKKLSGCDNPNVNCYPLAISNGTSDELTIRADHREGGGSSIYIKCPSKDNSNPTAACDIGNTYPYASVFVYTSANPNNYVQINLGKIKAGQPLTQVCANNNNQLSCN